MGEAEPVDAETIWLDIPADFEPGEITVIERPDGIDDHCRDGIAEIFEGAGWESERFPKGTGKLWDAFDSHASLPGLNDEIVWGRADCEASAGKASAWSVGGGSVGGKLSCEEKDYPTDLGEGCRTAGDCRIQTSLQFSPFDASVVPFGIRVVFDYKAKLAPGALFTVGIGDLAHLTDDGLPLIETAKGLERDTADEWIGAHVVEFEKATGIEQLVIAFVYEHDPAEPGGYGVFIDNVHAYALFRGDAPVCPSPTFAPTAPPSPTPIPTATPEPGVTPSATIGPTEDPPTPEPTEEPTPTEEIIRAIYLADVRNSL